MMLHNLEYYSQFPDSRWERYFWECEKPGNGEASSFQCCSHSQIVPSTIGNNNYICISIDCDSFLNSILTLLRRRSIPGMTIPRNTSTSSSFKEIAHHIMAKNQIEAVG